MRFATYPNKNFIENYPWAEEIPAHWESIRLGFLIEMLVGNAFSSDRFEFEGGTRLVRGDNVTEGRLRWGDKQRCWPEVTKNIERYLLADGDVLIGMDGSKVGKNYALVQREDLPLLLVQRVARLRSSSKIYPQYLRYLIGSPLFLSWVEQRKTDPMVPHITAKDICNYRVCCPGYKEQQTIARFLDFKTAQIDALIAKKKALLDKLAEKRTALISHAVTKGLDPTMPMKDSGVAWLREIPIDWTTKRLRFLTTMSGGMTPSTSNSEYWGGEIPWITPKDMKSEMLSGSIDTLTDVALQETGITLHDSGRVLIVVRGMILAHTFPVAINNVPSTVNQDMKALSTTLDYEYLALLLRGIQPLILSVVEESAHGTKVLRTDIFKNISLPVPPPDIQKIIVKQVTSLVTKLDVQKQHVESVIERLKEYRSALITNAVTGKIDVRGFEIPKPAEGIA